MHTEHGFFKVASQSLYCGLYMPERPAKLCAVMLEPFGEEKRCAYRMLVRLAWKLAEAGVAAFRFDLDGTGDSPGTHAEATWEHWQQETAEAVSVARKVSGAERCVLLGFRAGAMLASWGAASGLCCAVSLVEPVLSGAELLNDLERRQKIKDMTMPVRRAALPEGVRDFGGFVVGREMASQLSKASLLEDIKSIEGVSMQVVRVSGGKTFPVSWGALIERARCGGEVLIVVDKPFWGQVDYFESDAVIEPVVSFCVSHIEQ